MPFACWLAMVVDWQEVSIHTGTMGVLVQKWRHLTEFFELFFQPIVGIPDYRTPTSTGGDT